MQKKGRYKQNEKIGQVNLLANKKYVYEIFGLKLHENYVIIFIILF